MVCAFEPTSQDGSNYVSQISCYYARGRKDTKINYYELEQIDASKILDGLHSMIAAAAEISSFSGSTTEQYMELLTHPVVMSSLIALSLLPIFSADFVLEFKDNFGKEMRPTQNQATDLEQSSTAGSTTERGWNRRGKMPTKQVEWRVRSIRRAKRKSR